MNSGGTGPRVEGQTTSSSSEVCSSLLKGQRQPGGTLQPQGSTFAVDGGKSRCLPSKARKDGSLSYVSHDEGLNPGPHLETGLRHG